MRIERWDGATARARAGEVWPVYDAVFGDVADEATWRERSCEPHSRRDGFLLAAAVDEDGLAGYAWAYVGERGQWFPDRVVEALGPGADAWVGGHWEVVVLAVLAHRRRQGIGGRLMDAVVEPRGSRPALLATDADDSPAVRLYEGRGWRTLGPFTPGKRPMGLDAPR